jgi:hypothetical protein
MMGIQRARSSAGVLLLAAIVACGGNKPAAPSASLYGQATPTSSPSSTPTPSPSSTAAAPSEPPAKAAAPHVFVVVMENMGLGRALRSQPIARLASANAIATNYRAVARPSLPNYLALTSGSTWGIADNGYHSLPASDLGTQLTAAGVSWRAYMEGMTADGGCMRSPYPYALKHNPFAYYGGTCPENVVPIELLDADLAGETPGFVWITPGLCHDGHDCALEVAGAWLDNTVSRIMATDAWRSSGVLFIVWDEGDGGDTNLVPLIVLTKDATATRVETEYDHYSLLATIEDLFGLPRLGAAATARPLTPLIAGWSH